MPRGSMRSWPWSFRTTRRTRTCGRAVRRTRSLEATYNDLDWKDRLGGITPEMTRDAFGRIDKYYYNTPDLKKMGVDSIERLTVLAETTALFKVFSGLSNPEKRQQFIAKLRRQADLLGKAETVGVSQLHSTLEEVLAANRATVGLPDEVVISEYVNGGFEALDRYSSMIWPAEQAEFRKHTTGEFSGVGIQISMENEKIKVFSPLEDTPAYKAGVEPGDTIVAIEGKPVKGITLEQAVRRITGEAGTSVTLTMERPGLASPFDVKMKRQKIVVPTVKGWDRSGPEWNYFIDKESKIAYLRVVSFTETTTDAFRSALEQLRKQGMKGVIVDLRVNPGGLLKTAVEMCEMFLPPGKDIVSTKGRASEPWQIKSRASGEFAGLPLIILINDYSASASEIMAGALHAQGAALLVGERTWGKGSVQNPWPLGSSDAMLKLTTALYYLPFMERSIHRDEDSKEWGVAPDVQVKPDAEGGPPGAGTAPQQRRTAWQERGGAGHGDGAGYAAGGRRAGRGRRARAGSEGGPASGDSAAADAGAAALEGAVVDSDGECFGRRRRRSWSRSGRRSRGETAVANDIG